MIVDKEIVLAAYPNADAVLDAAIGKYITARYSRGRIIILSGAWETEAQAWQHARITVNAEMMRLLEN